MNNLKGIFIICLLLFPVYARAQTNVFRVETGKIFHITIRDAAFLFDHADYAIFIPDNVKTIRGVFVHQHGCTMEGHGASTAYDIQYQAFAKKWSLAVVGSDLYPKQGRNCRDWINPESGSAPALIQALATIGETSVHPELKDAPWLLWGHSGGGYWTLSMMRDYPERILAAFAYSPAFNPGWDFPVAAAKIPLMIRHAGKDDFNAPAAECWGTALNIFDKLRQMNGQVSIACNAGQTHNFSYVRYMAIPFYESVMMQRLPEIPSGQLRDIRPDLMWIGDTTDYNIYRASTYTGDPSALCHFPDSSAAAKWREYVITGTVTDRTPPPAPYDVEISRICGNQAELTWKADADVESGIHHFVIRLNGKEVAHFPSQGDYQHFDTNGDNAIPFNPPEMKFTVIMPYQEVECMVSVSTVNHSHLESKPSEIKFKSF